jgi:sulfide:quinone oxidoreductase
MSAKPRILVLGGGFGGLESLFYLKHVLADRANLTLVTDRPYFLFKPNTIYIPFGDAPEKFEIDLVHPCKSRGFTWFRRRFVM